MRSCPGSWPSAFKSERGEPIASGAHELASEQLCDHCRGPGRTIGLDRAIGGLPANFGGDCRRDRFFGRGPEIQAAARTVAAKAVRDVEVLLAVVAERGV